MNTPTELILQGFIIFLVVGFIIPAAVGLLLRTPWPSEGGSKRRYRNKW